MTLDDLTSKQLEELQDQEGVSDIDEEIDEEAVEDDDQDDSSDEDVNEGNEGNLSKAVREKNRKLRERNKRIEELERRLEELENSSGSYITEEVSRNMKQSSYTGESSGKLESEIKKVSDYLNSSQGVTLKSDNPALYSEYGAYLANLKSDLALARQYEYDQTKKQQGLRNSIIDSIVSRHKDLSKKEAEYIFSTADFSSGNVDRAISNSYKAFIKMIEDRTNDKAGKRTVKKKLSGGKPSGGGSGDSGLNSMEQRALNVLRKNKEDYETKLEFVKTFPNKYPGGIKDYVKKNAKRILEGE